MFRKNTAGQFIHFQGVTASTGGILTGATFTARRCIDGTFAAATGTVTEDGVTGWYKFAMSQADTNGNNIGFNFTATSAVPQTVNIVTTVLDPTSTAFGLVIAKTTNITGFNDIAATAIVSAGAITTLSGAVVNVDLVDLCTTTTTTTTVTNQLTAAAIATGVWQDATAGDFTAALSIGKSVMNGVALGTGLTIVSVSGAVGSVTGAVGSVTGAVGSVTGLTASNLDATITSRMATYVQPAGFLAATFPTGTVANTTNITAGTITTATNLTTNNDKTGYSLTQTFPTNFSASVITAGGIVSSNVKQVNDITVIGAGTVASPWGP